MRNFVVGSSAAAIKTSNSTTIACDTQLSYGGLNKFSFRRLFHFDNTLIAFSGELSNIQHLVKFIIMEKQRNDDSFLETRSYFNMIQRYLYTLRSKMQPLNVECIIGGADFLGMVNSLGNFFESDVICNGLASYLATPMLRKNDGVDSVTKIEDAMRIMFARCTKSSNEIQIGVIDAQGVRIIEKKIDIDWGKGLLPNERLFL